MKIRTEPMLGGAAFSFVILLVVNLTGIFLTMNAAINIVEDLMSPNYDPLASTSASSLLYLMSCLSCISLLVAGIGAGVVYARQHAKIEPITGSLIGGGAASGALGFFIAGICVGVAAGLMVIPLMNQLSAAAPELTASMYGGSATSLGVLSSIMYGGCYGIIYALIGAVLGMIGAAIGVPKSAKTTPA